jgi:hypothetical protein
MLLTGVVRGLLGPNEEATRVAEANATLRAQVGSLEERERGLATTAAAIEIIVDSLSNIEFVDRSCIIHTAT